MLRLIAAAVCRRQTEYCNYPTGHVHAVKTRQNKNVEAKRLLENEIPSSGNR